MNVQPTKPPPAASGVNAETQINLIAGHTKSELMQSTTKQPITYNTAMTGTNIVHTLAILFIPPTTTRAASSVTTRPETYGLTPITSFASVEIAFACTVQPMPNDAKAVNNANNTPAHLAFKPYSRAYIGPPTMCPLSDTRRYFTASKPSPYFVAIPNMPAIQHQNTAPGPPRAMAVPTPIILPVPIVAARAVARAPN